MKRRVAWTGAVALALAIAGCSKDETPPPAMSSPMPSTL